jgi:transcriptional/translational regulatory protein YebC/TACO1
VLSAGANDLKTDDEECYEVLCPISEFYNLENVLSEAKVAVQSSELAYIPNTFVEITDQDVADKLMRTMEKLDDLDDVKNVFANFELGDNIVVE